MSNPLNTTNTTQCNTPYTTRLYNWNNSSDHIISIVKQLHVWGIGIRLGMDEEEHFQKVVQEIQGHSVLAVFSGDELIGGVSILPELLSNSHYPGKSIATGFLVCEPYHPKAVATLYKNLKRIVRENGAEWLILTRAVSDTAYLQKGVRV